eukprot:g6123.t1 g6123   contig20:854667-855714(-)
MNQTLLYSSLLACYIQNVVGFQSLQHHHCASHQASYYDADKVVRQWRMQSRRNERSFANAALLQSSRQDNYYGGFDSSYMVKEFSIYEQLEDIVNLASKPLPERPDGIVTVAKFTSSESPDCRASEASYERLARDNPATSLDLFSEPSTDPAATTTSTTPQPSPWGQGSSKSDYAKTPRTTAAFIPGYDWNKRGGFFDELANDVQKNSGFDFEKSYEDDWMPKVED